MRATDFVTEIERIGKYDFTGGKEFLKDPYHTKKINGKDVKPLPGGSGFNYAISTNSTRGDLTINMLDKSGTEVIGSLLLDSHKNSFPISNAYSVNVITVDEDYRNQGIAKSLYGIALTILKITLLAGTSQTPGGRKNWLSLANIPGVEIKGYVVIDEADLKTDRQIDKKLHDKFDIESIKRRNAKAEERINILMSKLGGQYMGSVDGDAMYFAFDVVPGTAELKPAVKTQLNTLYYSDYVMYYFTGLYAKWSGQ